MRDDVLDVLFDLCDQFVRYNDGRSFAKFARYVRLRSSYRGWMERKPFLKYVWDTLAVEKFSKYNLTEVSRNEVAKICTPLEQFHLEHIIGDIASLQADLDDLLTDSASNDYKYFNPWNSNQERERLPEEWIYNRWMKRYAYLVYTPWATSERFKQLEDKIKHFIGYCSKIREAIGVGEHPFGQYCECRGETLAKELIEHYECEIDFKVFLECQLENACEALEYDNETDTHKDDEGNVVNPEKISLELTFNDCWHGLRDYSDIGDYEDLIEANQYFRKPFEDMFKSCIEGYENYNYIPYHAVIKKEVEPQLTEQMTLKLPEGTHLCMDYVWEVFNDVKEKVDLLLVNYKETKEIGVDYVDWSESMEDAVDRTANYLQCVSLTLWKTEKAWLTFEEQLQALVKYCQGIQETIRQGAHPFSEKVKRDIDFFCSLFDRWWGAGEAFEKFLEEISRRIHTIRDYEEKEYHDASFTRSLTFEDCWKGMLRYMKYSDLIDERLLLSPHFCKTLENTIFKEQCQKHKHIQYINRNLDSTDENDDELSVSLNCRFKGDHL